MKIWIAVLALMLVTSAVKCSSLSDTQANSDASSCALPAPTHPSFHCINNQWSSNDSFTVDTLALPRNAGVVVFNGNVSIATLIINGLATQFKLQGTFIIPNMRFVLNNADMKALDTEKQYEGLSSSQRIVAFGTFHENAGISYWNQYTENVLESSSCIRAKVVDGTDPIPNKYIVTFSMDTIRCKIWWIVLLSIIGAVLIAVGIFLCCKCCLRNPRKSTTNGGFTNYSSH